MKNERRTATFVTSSALARLGGDCGKGRPLAFFRVERPNHYLFLAHNVRSPEEVDAVIAEAESAGAAISRQPGETFWGGYSGAFVDPDGHAWEVAHNPFWPIADDGSISLSG